jgi:hypothetical protein
VPTADALRVRFLIHAHANANADGKYDALLHESSMTIRVGVSVIIAECVSRRSSTAIATANASVLASSTALVRRCLATRNVTVFASKSTTVPNCNFLMRKLVSVSAQQSRYV